MLIEFVDPEKLSSEDKTEFIRIKTAIEDEIKRLMAEVSALQKEYGQESA
jgi:hypothetical protein